MLALYNITENFASPFLIFYIFTKNSAAGGHSERRVKVF